MPASDVRRLVLRSGAGAIALLALHASCVATYDPGTAVTLSIEGRLEGAVDSLGRLVRIDRAYLSVAEAELVPCEPRAELFSLRSVARAHHGSADGGALRTGHFVALHEGPYELGVLSPVPDRYCALRVTFEPTDADTEGVAEAGYGDGLTIASEGEWQAIHETGPARAEAAGSAVFEVAFDAPLVVSADEPEAALLLTVDLAGAYGATDASADPWDVGLDLVAHLDEHTTAR